MVITMSTRIVNVYVTDNHGYVLFVLVSVYVTDNHGYVPFVLVSVYVTDNHGHVPFVLFTLFVTDVFRTNILVKLDPFLVHDVLMNIPGH